MPLYADTLKHRTPFGSYPQIAVDDSWPEAHHEAQDEIGRRVIGYYSKWKDHPDFPPSPWDDRTGTIALIPLDEVRPETDEMPKYRVVEAAAFVGCVLYTKDQVVPFTGWIANPWTVEAVNESARLVLAYQTKFAAGQKLAGSPYQSDGRLHFENPANRASPGMPLVRWG